MSRIHAARIEGGKKLAYCLEREVFWCDAWSANSLGGVWSRVSNYGDSVSRGPGLSACRSRARSNGASQSGPTHLGWSAHLPESSPL